ncbi:MAG: FprA family A-type flavoprotein [Exilispira sp.]
MKAFKIKDNIYWVGAIDWDLRDFHGYTTERGSTYNSYLIIDEKIVLVDTVKHYLFEEMLGRISSIIDPSKIDYIIAQHVEMDHSGSLEKLIKIAPNAKIITSSFGEKGLKKHFSSINLYNVVKNEEILNTGKYNLTFIMETMVHWPDNMGTYLKEEKIFFSQDAFGQHLASFERFAKDFGKDILFEEAKKYYANIVLPYGGQVQKVLKQASKLDIQIICPSHGLIWNDYIDEIVAKYDKWSRYEVDEKAVIIYDTMWESTKKLAYAVAEVFEDLDIGYELLNLKVNNNSNIITKLIDARYIAIGSPTLNSGILPTVGSFLTYLKGLAPKNRIGFAFGSYGWGGQSVPELEKILSTMGFNMIPSFSCNYIPLAEDIIKLKQQLKNSLISLK